MYAGLIFPWTFLRTKNSADNNDFCKIPLTTHLRSNPFQYRTDLNPEPVFLIHAIMALAGHHVNSPYLQDHRHAALQLLHKHLVTYTRPRDVYSMLDAIIILFSLDVRGSQSSQASFLLINNCAGVTICPWKLEHSFGWGLWPS